MPTGYIYFNDMIKDYKDVDKVICPEIKNKYSSNVITRLKEIDFRVYVDLWKNKKTEAPRGSVNAHIITETVKKITICFLKEEKDSNKEFQLYRYTKPNFNYPENEMQIKLTIDSGETGKGIYIKYSGQSSKTSPRKCVYIPLDLIAPGNYLCECDICIEDSTRNIPGEGKNKFEVCATLIHKDKNDKDTKINERKMPLFIYRTPAFEGGDDPFLSLKENEKSKDFFVMPRVNQEEKHKPFIKKLQVYSNQVLARHKGLRQKDANISVQDGMFDFVKEDGIYDEQLGVNYGMSIPVFKATRKTSESFPAIMDLYPVVKYDLNSFGQGGAIISYLCSNYDINEVILKKIVIDKIFIYGEKENQVTIENIQGIKNIYEKIVSVFREQFFREAQKYVDFGSPNLNPSNSYRWLSRPKDNPNYKRGPLAIRNESIQVYAQETGGQPIAIGTANTPNYCPAGTDLQSGTIITFKKGSDEYDYETTGSRRYQVEAIRLPNQTSLSAVIGEWYVPLTYTYKRNCRDKEYEQNFCNYAEQQSGLTSDDSSAIEQYRTHYGVPYYMSPGEGDEFKGNYGGKEELRTFNERLNNNATYDNWYSYPDNIRVKPNAPTGYESGGTRDIEGLGLDCSGLIINCLLDIHLQNIGRTIFFADPNGLRGYGQRAPNIGRERSRKIDINIMNDSNTLVQAGDILYSNGHIAIITIDRDNIDLDRHLTDSEKKSRYFTIIHNYGGKQIYLGNNVPFDLGFFQKTLKGPFRHWGVLLDNNLASAGRIYLWY
jgi:hypothetical protein